MQRLTSQRKLAILACFGCWIGAAIIACQAYGPAKLNSDEMDRLGSTPQATLMAAPANPNNQTPVVITVAAAR